VNTSATAYALGQYGGAAPAFSSTDAGEAIGDAAPTATATNAVLTANSAIKTEFGASPKFFALGEVGGRHATAGTDVETTTSSVTVDVDLAELATPGDLILGLYDGDAVGAGVTGVTLTVSGVGVTTFTEAFASGALARTGFTDKAFNLGSLASTGTLDLTVSLTVTSDAAGSGFFGDFIVGDPPPAAAKLTAAMAAFGGHSGEAVAWAPTASRAGSQLLVHAA
jgi:hypothetical protein